MARFAEFLRRFFVQADYLALLAAVFLAAALVVGVIALVISRRRQIKGRFSEIVRREAVEEKEVVTDLLEPPSDGFVVKLAAPLEKVFGAGKKRRGHVSGFLATAGIRSPEARRVFLASELLSGAFFCVAFLAVAFYYRMPLYAVAIAAGIGVMGFFLPDLVVYTVAQRRKRSITRAFPDSLDLMVVCAEAGIALDMTFKRVGEEIRPICPALSDEFFQTNLEIRAGRPRSESLRRMGDRTGVDDVKSLMSLLAQANRFGTSIARTLRVQSDAMRVKRRQLAETEAAKLAVKLIFPLVAFIFPALFVVLLGPAAIRVARLLIPALGGGS